MEIIENLRDLRVQTWKNAANTTDCINLSLEEICRKIKTNADSDEYMALQDLAEKEILSTNKNMELELKKKYNKLKEKLPLITFSANMNNYRSAENMNHYTGLIVLDIDLSANPFLPIRIDVLKRNICDNLLTMLCFDSPRGRGNGLKIVVKAFLNERIKTINKELKRDDLNKTERNELIAEIKDFHSIAYSKIKDYYEKNYDIIIDNNAKAILGNCFLSADRDIYSNINSPACKCFWVYAPSKKKLLSNDMNIQILLNTMNTNHINILDEIFNYYQKFDLGRNNTTFRVAMQAKYYDISKQEIVSYILSKIGATDFDETEIRKTVISGLKNIPQKQFLIKELYLQKTKQNNNL